MENFTAKNAVRNAWVDAEFKSNTQLPTPENVPLENNHSQLQLSSNLDSLLVEIAWKKLNG